MVCLSFAIFALCSLYASAIILHTGDIAPQREARQNRRTGPGLISSTRSWFMCGIVKMMVR